VRIAEVTVYQRSNRNILAIPIEVYDIGGKRPPSLRSKGEAKIVKTFGDAAEAEARFAELKQAIDPHSDLNFPCLSLC